MDPALATLVGLALALALVATVLGALALARRDARGQEARAGAAELALRDRRIAELEAELAAVRAQARAGHDAAAEVVATERALGDAARVPDARVRHGLLLDDAAPGDRGPADAAAGPAA